MLFNLDIRIHTVKTNFPRFFFVLKKIYYSVKCNFFFLIWIRSGIRKFKMYRIINICHNMICRSYADGWKWQMNFFTVLKLISIVGTQLYHAELPVEFYVIMDFTPKSAKNQFFWLYIRISKLILSIPRRKKGVVLESMQDFEQK